MLRRTSLGALLALTLIGGTARAAVPRSTHRRSGDGLPGTTRSTPIPSPGGFVLGASDGYRLIVNTASPRSPGRSRLSVEAAGEAGSVTYSASADLEGEGIHAKLGRFGQVDLRWVPDGGVREIRGRCGDRHTQFFFSTGEYVGTFRFRGGGDFSTAKAHRIRWSRRWYGHTLGCELWIGGGFPGPGTTLEVSYRKKSFGSSELFAGRNAPEAAVSFSAEQRERVGRIEVDRRAFASGGPKTLEVAPDYRTGEVSPPAPFSGAARFERTSHARGTWLGDLSVDFPDRSDVPLAGTPFEATLHSGFAEEGLR